MSKTNFSKVEKSLDDGLMKIKSDSLLKEADAAQGKKTTHIPSKELCSSILKGIDQDLNTLLKQDDQLLDKIPMEDIDLKKLIANPSLLTLENWKSIQKIKERLEKYKKNLKEQLPYESDDDIVETERSKQAALRLNVNKKWISLDTRGP